jgi:hypothetical protein
MYTRRLDLSRQRQILVELLSPIDKEAKTQCSKSEVRIWLR